MYKDFLIKAVKNKFKKGIQYTQIIMILIVGSPIHIKNTMELCTMKGFYAFWEVLGFYPEGV